MRPTGGTLQHSTDTARALTPGWRAPCCCCCCRVRDGDESDGEEGTGRGGFGEHTNPTAAAGAAVAGGRVFMRFTPDGQPEAVSVCAAPVPCRIGVQHVIAEFS